MEPGHLGIGLHPLDLALQLAELGGDLGAVALLQRLGHLALLLGALGTVDENLTLLLHLGKLVGDLGHLGALTGQDGREVLLLGLDLLNLGEGLLLGHQRFAGQRLTVVGNGKLRPLVPSLGTGLEILSLP